MREAFQNQTYRDRAVSFLAIFTAVLLWLAVLNKRDLRVPDLVMAALFIVLGYRNWRAGLFVSKDGVVVRNVASSRRIPMADVSRAVFVLSPTHNAAWGLIGVETVSGTRFFVRSLRRDASGGAQLVQAINSTIERIRKNS